MYCKFHSHTQSFQVRRLLLLGVSAPFRSRPRLFASAAGSIKDNSRQARYHEDKEWPKTLKPTPYEVFGIPAGSRIDQGKLKKRYHELAKLYHPDIAGTIVILSHPRSVENQHAATQIANSSLVSLDHKEKLYRFRLINDAYSLLSNSSQRQFYDNFKSGWAHGPVKPPVTMSHATYHSDPRYYNAGTWEDFTNLNDEAGTGPMQRISPWTALALVAGLVACMQMASLLTHMQQGLTQRFFTQDETERDLTLAYINYGMDTDKWTRLRRFLWFRTWGLYRNKEDLDREAVLNEKIIEQLKIAGRTDDQDLDNIRKELVRMEDSIIFNFIERSYFMTSPVIYKANDERLPIPNFKGSLLDWTLLHTEMEQSKLRRFESPDQTPFYPENLCAPILPNLSYPRVLAPAGQKVNYNEKIKSIYVEHVVPLISHCDGNSWENLGSTVTADVDALQSLSRRIHFGKFVAEAKFRKNEEKYTQMIRAHDVDGIVASITDSAVEEKILERLKLKAAAYGVDPTDRNGTKKITPEYLVTIYKDYVIPLTKDVEVDYLLRRLE